MRLRAQFGLFAQNPVTCTFDAGAASCTSRAVHAGMRGVPSLEGMVGRLGGDGNGPQGGGSSPSVPIGSL